MKSVWLQFINILSPDPEMPVIDITIFDSIPPIHTRLNLFHRVRHELTLCSFLAFIYATASFVTDDIGLYESL